MVMFALSCERLVGGLQTDVQADRQWEYGKGSRRWILEDKGLEASQGGQTRGGEPGGCQMEVSGWVGWGLDCFTLTSPHLHLAIPLPPSLGHHHLWPGRLCQPLHWASCPHSTLNSPFPIMEQQKGLSKHCHGDHTP
uniref:Uncharacterized protein n=1 Tax=Myotis myotis TaxID=51298 RepID=A0A7J7VZ62_MYOMY|nr:hypothetical protein mMyoMyo1_012307 [Myotis myotis]